MKKKLKRQWIKALEDLIDLYKDEIDNDAIHNTHACPLCIIDSLEAIKVKEIPYCNYCILLNEEYGRGKPCFEDPTYHGSNDDLNWNNDWIPDRIRIHEIIINKLKASL